MPTCVFCGDQVATETTHKSWGDCRRAERRKRAELAAELATCRQDLADARAHWAAAERKAASYEYQAVAAGDYPLRWEG